jgi:hypothetical protein
MTLLIETMSKDHAMLTADGLSRPNCSTGAGINRDDLRKIFPLSNVPIAIAHHGINIIHGTEVGHLISEFEESVGANPSGLIEEANRLARSARLVLTSLFGCHLMKSLP